MNKKFTELKGNIAYLTYINKDNKIVLSTTPKYPHIKPFMEVGSKFSYSSEEEMKYKDLEPGLYIMDV